MVIGGFAMTRLNFVNKVGIPTIATTGATLTDTGLTYSFNNHPYIRLGFQGLFVVKVSSTPTAPSTAVPVYFTTTGVSNSTVEVCNAAGTALTTSTFPGDGVYVFFWDDTTKILRLLTSNIS